MAVVFALTSDHVGREGVPLDLQWFGELCTVTAVCQVFNASDVGSHLRLRGMRTRTLVLSIPFQRMQRIHATRLLSAALPKIHVDDPEHHEFLHVCI